MSSYEVRDAESLLVEIEGWRPKPDLDLERDATGRLAGFEAHYQRRPRATRGVGDRVLVARLEWKRGDHLVVETNSTERDLEIRERLLGSSASDVRLLRVLGRSALDLASEPVREEDRQRSEKDQEKLARHPEVQARLARMMRDYSLRWCDTVVPALGNRRPKSLVRTEKGRAKVLALIEEMESRSRPGGTGGMDFALIRRELDLPSSL
jgi:hypothetical protein